MKTKQSQTADYAPGLQFATGSVYNDNTTMLNDVNSLEIYDQAYYLSQLLIQWASQHVWSNCTLL